MSAELNLHLDNPNVTLLAEGKGIFDVVVDDRLVFSKYKQHRFPERGEVLKLINSAIRVD